jgi:hypothetical protein
MSDETKRVLDMLAQGKINAEEANRLLERLAQAGQAAGAGEAGRGSGPGPAGSGASDAGAAGQPGPGGKPKFLRIVVHSVDGDQVNVRVPLALVRTGIKLSAMLPEGARVRLGEKGIDLSQLTGMESEEMVDALRELTVDVDSAKGDVVRIFCE